MAQGQSRLTLAGVSVTPEIHRRIRPRITLAERLNNNGVRIVTGRLVIVGAGQAGFALAAKLRALGDSRPITIVGAEESLPYQRPPLTKKYLLGEMAFDRLLDRKSVV